MASKNLTQRWRLEQKPQDKKHAPKSHLTYPRGSESQAPDSAIVACSSTNIETCRSPSPHETDKTTHTSGMMQGFSTSYSCLRFGITRLSEDQAWAWHRGSVAFGDERNSCFCRTETTNTHARPQTRAEYLAKNGFTKLRLMPKIWHHKLQQGSSLDVPPCARAHKKTQTARPETYNAARKLRMQ